jgi:biotin transport system substrate-specific component
MRRHRRGSRVPPLTTTDREETSMHSPATAPARAVLTDLIQPADGRGLWLKRALLLGLGVAALVIAAKIRVPFWPVPMTMQTFAVLSIGAAYGWRLGGATVLAYLAVGALGFDVFTSSSAEIHGLAYMMGGTGGYLAGFVLAAIALGALARAGWDRSPLRMGAAMLAGQVLVFLPGVLWLGHLYAGAQGWGWVLEVGLVNFLPAEALKMALAALLFPALWRMTGNARG